jgi:hypothetical protein
MGNLFSLHSSTNILLLFCYSSSSFMIKSNELINFYCLQLYWTKLAVVVYTVQWYPQCLFWFSLDHHNSSCIFSGQHTYKACH